MPLEQRFRFPVRWLFVLVVAFGYFPASALAVPPEVTLVEAGFEGKVVPGIPFRAVFEVSARERFTGSLRVALRSTSTLPSLSSALGFGNVASRDLDVAPGAPTRFELALPLMPQAAEVPRLLSWRVDDRSGARIAGGEATVPTDRIPGGPAARLGMYRGPVRILRIGGAAEDPHSIPIEQAFSRVDDYSPFGQVVVTGDDLLRMEPSRRAILRDAVALWLALIVVPPGPAVEDLPPEFARPLLDRSSSMGRFSRGEELREAPLGFGWVRWTDSTTAATKRDEGAADPLGGLALLDVPLRPGEKAVGSSRIPPPKAEGKSLPPKEALHHIPFRFGVAAPGVLLLAVLVLLLVAGVRERPVGRWLLVALAAGSAGGVLVVPFLASRRPEANIESRREIRFHDRAAGLTLSDTLTIRGGGGGAGPTALDFVAGPRSIGHLARIGVNQEWEVRLHHGDEGHLRAEAEPPAFATTQVLVLRQREVADFSPPWTFETGADGSPTAVLFRRPLDPVYLHLPGRFLALGAVEAGRRIAFDALPPPPREISWAEFEIAVTHRDQAESHLHQSGDGRFNPDSHSPARLVGAEPAGATGSVGGPESGVVHVEEFVKLPAGPSIPDLLRLKVPARAEGGVLTIWLSPEAYREIGAIDLARWTIQPSLFEENFGEGRIFLKSGLSPLARGTFLPPDANGWRAVRLPLPPERPNEATFRPSGWQVAELYAGSQ